MIKQLALLLFLFSFIALAATAQRVDRTSLREKVIQELRFNNRVLKDSVALYTFNIQLQISRKENKAFVEKVSASDSIARKVFENIEILKTYDYTGFTNKKKGIRIVIPFAIIVSNHPGRTSEPKIPVRDLRYKIASLFDSTPSESAATDETIFIDPIVIYTDTNIDD